MPRIKTQTPLTTVRRPIDTGTNGSIRLCLSNYTAGAVLAKFYLVPTKNPSSTITDHLIWIISVPANTTSVFNEHFPLSTSTEFALEAEAASDNALVVSTLIG